MGLRFNPPPGWPPVPEGFTPQPGWQPDPSWPPAPPGWQLWISDDQAAADPSEATSPSQQGAPPLPASNWVALYGSPGTPYGVPGRPPGTGPTSGWAIASFVLGLISVVVLSVIFSFIALRRIKRLGQRGRGLAIAGLALSGFWVVVLVAAIVAANMGKATR